jgi:probable FeS assembly SUF system protein SufT
MHEPIVLKRDVDVVLIPSGERMTLPAGSIVIVTQALGGTFTVSTDIGSLARIPAKDADALGLEPSAAGAAPKVDAAGGAALDQAAVERMVWEQLKTCYDPEIPVNIVELGLVYENRVEAHAGGGWRVSVKMTLTAPGCGMGPILQVEAQQKILSLPGVKEARVEFVLEPPWNMSMMSDAAKLQLGMM